MHWNKWIRQGHRWLSILFTLTVVANFVTMALGTPPPWIVYSPLLPLFLLLFSGLYMFVLPYAARRHGGAAGARAAGNGGSPEHHAVAIVPSGDLDASAAFYRKLGFEIASDHGHYRILADSRGWHLHLNKVQGWPRSVEDNPLGLYLYVEDVDAVADQVRELIIEPGAPHHKPWGTYEFAVSDPSGTLVRVGRIPG